MKPLSACVIDRTRDARHTRPCGRKPRSSNRPAADWSAPPRHNRGRTSSSRRGEILHHDVGLGDQLARHFKCGGIGEVERDAALVAIQGEIGGTLAADFRMLIVAGIVAAIGVFDLDDLGAEIGQRLRAGRPATTRVKSTTNRPSRADGAPFARGSRSGNGGLAVMIGPSSSDMGLASAGWPLRGLTLWSIYG